MKSELPFKMISYWRISHHLSIPASFSFIFGTNRCFFGWLLVEALVCVGPSGRTARRDTTVVFVFGVTKSPKILRFARSIHRTQKSCYTHGNSLLQQRY